MKPTISASMSRSAARAPWTLSPHGSPWRERVPADQFRRRRVPGVAETMFESTSPRLGQLLADIERGKLALPELQRPFVWQKAAVRDLLDSMYRGFPVGYLML